MVDLKLQRLSVQYWAYRINIPSKHRLCPVAGIGGDSFACTKRDFN
jgi:hypothetical protein